MATKKALLFSILMINTVIYGIEQAPVADIAAQATPTAKTGFAQFQDRLKSIVALPRRDAKIIYNWCVKTYKKQPISQAEQKQFQQVLERANIVAKTGLVIIGLAYSALIAYQYRHSIQNKYQQLRYEYQIYQYKKYLKKDHADAVKSMAKSIDILTSQRDPAALLFAVDTGNIEQVKNALDAGINPNQRTEYFGLPIEKANYLFYSHPQDGKQIIKLLIEHDADPYTPVSLTNQDPINVIKITGEIANDSSLAPYAIKNSRGKYTHMAPYLFMAPEVREFVDKTVNEVSAPNRRAMLEFVKGNTRPNLPQLPKDIVKKITGLVVPVQKPKPAVKS